MTEYNNPASFDSYYERVIIGGGVYGVYAAIQFSKKGLKTIILNNDEDLIERGSLVNQARVHDGYHYPRAFDTAKKSHEYYHRFCEDYGFCINSSFEQIYSISAKNSKTNAEQFKEFCNELRIKCEDLNNDDYFRKGMCEASYLTEETSFDAKQLRNNLKKQLTDLGTPVICGCNIQSIVKTTIEENDKKIEVFKILTDKGEYITPYVLNATYAGINQIQKMAGLKLYDIKYELCEVILCEVSDNLKDKGITVMDGHFFSVMPFGNTGLHSITSVQFTPHETCYKLLPEFECQKRSNGYCSTTHLGNCNKCKVRPETSWNEMKKLSDKYLLDSYEITYVSSLFAIKPILKASENDDSRPTLIDIHCKNPTFVTVLSGKINTIYDLDILLKDE